MSERTANRRRAIRAIWSLGAGLALGLGGCAQGEGGPGGGDGFQMPPMPVEATTVHPENIADRFEAVGTIEAGEAITVVTEIDAIVRRLPFREGHPIRRGEVIAQLEDTELRAQLDRAQAVLEQKQVAHDRVAKVVEQGAAAPQVLDDARADLRVAEADVALARARLAKTRIVAPFDGVIGARRVSPGAFLRAGAPITDLAQIYEIKVTFSAPERYVPALRRGAPVSLSTTAYPGRTLTGVVDVVEPVLDADTRSASIIARAVNPEQLFRPGMSVDVSVVLVEKENALMVPDEALFAEGDQLFVYLIGEDSTVTMAPVTTGIRLAHSAEVLTGLESGQRVVRAGHQKLRPGAKVMPISSQGPAGDPAAGGAAESGAAPPDGEATQ